MLGGAVVQFGSKNFISYFLKSDNTFLMLSLSLFDSLLPHQLKSKLHAFTAGLLNTKWHCKIHHKNNKDIYIFCATHFVYCVRAENSESE